MKVKVFRGLLGWSNKRSGLEFYRFDEKIIPRHGSEWGDLLALDDALEQAEGSPVIVAVLPRNAPLSDVVGAMRAVEQAIHETRSEAKNSQSDPHA